jgi:murein DD-endopeptidase MepM/ murein hydrolase activator NlpD
MIDYDLFEGLKSRAAADGVVVFAGSMGGYGYTVVIAHGKDGEGNYYYTQYSHHRPESFFVTLGQDVYRGQVLGILGNTGFVLPRAAPGDYTTGRHLHFELRISTSSDYGTTTWGNVRDTRPYGLKYRDHRH